MPIEIPRYLRGVAEVTKSKAENLTVALLCPCGCRTFSLLKNVPKKSIFDQALYDANNEWYRMLERDYPLSPKDRYCKSRNYFFIKKFFEKNGWYLRIYKAKDLHVNNYNHAETPAIKEFFFSYNRPSDELPVNPLDLRLDVDGGDDTMIYKAVCPACGAEHMLFDSRLHGNDAADFKPEQLDEYSFKPRKIAGSDAPVQIMIAVKNFWDFDDIEGNGNEGLTADDYSEMFGYIKIKATTSDAKIVTVYSAELG